MFYYILVDPDSPGRCKLGVTKNPDQRIKAYRTGSPNCHYLVVYDGVDKKHERRILDMLRDILTVRGEVVYGSPSMIQNHVEGYFTDNEIDV